MKIRVVKTASKARAVQIVRYQNNRRTILRHIGSAHTDAELQELMTTEEIIYSNENPFTTEKRSHSFRRFE
ncbi:hypothetical protein SAMN05421747_115102 [Parapedobacter composti]|uniref:Uncharacterized protein n=1 Tax=Parapedobacter composti TaxID=623281 RepID=A0A1I1KNK0_9SPHI|nr:hypothetical protein [Parapedobacter composti]SFC59040.1 hypothetical protein SAMN05421747_115102 [Parapedobacter composti]